MGLIEEANPNGGDMFRYLTIRNILEVQMIFGHLLRTIIKISVVIVDGSDVDRVCRLPGTLQLMCSFREDFINTAYQRLILGWIARIYVSLASIVKVQIKDSIKGLF